VTSRVKAPPKGRWEEHGFGLEHGRYMCLQRRIERLKDHRCFEKARTSTGYASSSSSSFILTNRPERDPHHHSQYHSLSKASGVYLQLFTSSSSIQCCPFSLTARKPKPKSPPIVPILRNSTSSALFPAHSTSHSAFPYLFSEYCRRHHPSNCRQ
jgi:hypothetical protein